MSHLNPAFVRQPQPAAAPGAAANPAAANPANPAAGASNGGPPDAHNAENVNVRVPTAAEASAATLPVKELNRALVEEIRRSIDWAAKPCSPADCATCSADPESHSVYERGVFRGMPIVYTKPAEAAKFSDHDGIVKHFQQMIGHHHPNKWVWVFDSTDMQMKHVLDPRVGVSIARMLTKKYKDSVSDIFVLNANAVLRISLFVVCPFLEKKVTDKIHVEVPGKTLS